jgi:hypothetical protein
MSVDTKRIFHIELDPADLSDESIGLNNTQLCVENDVDPVTGFRMWVGRDGEGGGPRTGNITKWLALDKAARVTSLEATTGLSVTSGSTITATQVALACAGEIRFTDEHTNGAGSNWSTSYMPFSESDYEWLVARALLGDTEGSILALIAAAAAYGGSTGDWDDVYNYGGAGGGRSASVDAGPWLATVPVGGSTGAMSLVNNATGNTAGILAIQNNATLSTGLSVDLSGATSGDSYDYDEMGAKVWTSGSVTMGNGAASPAYGYSRAYSRSFWENDPFITGGSAAQEIRAESGTTWQHYAYFRASVAQNDGYEAGRAYIKSTAATHLACNNFYVNDGNVSGSTWPGDEILFTYNTTEVSALDALVDGAGTNPSLGGAILAAAASGGAIDDTEIAFGTGVSITSSPNLTWASSVLAINGKMTLKNAAWGTPTEPSLASNTLTVNFSTGKDFQSIDLDDDADNLSITAPTGGAAKGLQIKLKCPTSSHTFGGGTGWDSIKWPDDAVLNPDTAAITIAATGGHALIVLTYEDSEWSGSIIRFPGGGA